MAAVPLSCSVDARGAGETSICGSIVDDRVRPPRVADGCCAPLVLDFASGGCAAALASRPPPVKPAEEWSAPLGISVDDRWRPARGGRVGVDEVV